MAETTDTSTAHNAWNTAEQWVCDTAAHAWQAVKDDPLGTVGTAAVIGLGTLGVGGALTLKLCGYGARAMIRRELMQAAFSRSVETEIAGTTAGAQAPWIDFAGSSMISDPALNRYVTSAERLAGQSGSKVGGELPLTRSYGPNPAMARESPSPLYMTANDSFSSINGKRMDTLLDMQARSRLPASDYLAQLAERGHIDPINADTFIARDDGYRVTVRLDENLSLRYKQGKLEVVDHEGQSSRLYSTDYGGMRATIHNGNSFGPGLNSLGARVSTEMVDAAEKQDWIKNWLYRDSDGQLLTARFRALTT